jgi:hypothetical protein
VNAAARARALDIGNRRDAGKRLAPEAKRPDRLEVGERPDLARRVALKGQRELLGGNPGAVVDDPDQVAAGAPDLDRDPVGAGVEGVLDQLFDNRRRPLHNLAGGDRIGDLGRQRSDRHESRDFSS